MGFVHAHFGSATHFIGTVLEVLVGFTFLRLLAFHMAKSRIPFVSGLGLAIGTQAR